VELRDEIADGGDIDAFRTIMLLDEKRQGIRRASPLPHSAGGSRCSSGATVSGTTIHRGIRAFR